MWPRQPRFKSWCGQTALRRHPVLPVLVRALALGVGRLSCPVCAAALHDWPSWLATCACPSSAAGGATSCWLHWTWQVDTLQGGLLPKSASSSGQDVALWPRQPRFKSWCGQTTLRRHPVLPVLVRPLALGVGRLSCLVCAAELHVWPSWHRHMCMPLLRSGRGDMVLAPLNLAVVQSAERASPQVRIV